MQPYAGWRDASGLRAAPSRTDAPDDVRCAGCIGHAQCSCPAHVGAGRLDLQRATPHGSSPGCVPLSRPGRRGNIGSMADLVPAVDDRHPADVIEKMVDHVLGLAATWPSWDGHPMEVTAEGGQPRTYTPNKALRRVADHLIDHLAELEARLAGCPSEPDAWHASMVTTPADLAAFTAEDLDEARSRLRRLALIWGIRLRSLSDERLDADEADAWTLRQIAFHVAESAFYADAVGALAG